MMNDYVILAISFLQISIIPWLFYNHVVYGIKARKLNVTGYVASFGGLLHIMLVEAFENKINSMLKKEKTSFYDKMLVIAICYLPPVATYFFASYIIGFMRDMI